MQLRFSCCSVLSTSCTTCSSERSQLQSYDINADNRSRLNLEEDSFREMFNHPLGMGPWGFAHATNWVSHEVYIGTFLNHGWIGGSAFLTLIVLTLIVGFRSIWIRTPWQPFMIATYVSFFAMMFEGVWGDIDHWRHFYILSRSRLGICRQRPNETPLDGAAPVSCATGTVP